MSCDNVMDTVDVHVGGSSIPYPPTPEGKAAAAKMQARVMSPSNKPLPETPAGIKPTARQLAFIPSPIPDTVHARARRQGCLTSPRGDKHCRHDQQKETGHSQGSSSCCGRARSARSHRHGSRPIGAIVPPSPVDSPNKLSNPQDRCSAAASRKSRGLPLTLQQSPNKT